jgi:ATP-dependent DNA helicase DinG
MLSQKSKDEIQALYRKLVEKMRLTPRYGQRVMIAEIAKSLGAIVEDDKDERSNEAGIAVIEAGTGTGKTLAYLAATLPMAMAAEKKLLISTATIALQEQILDKDIPAFRKNSEIPFKYALAKGRGRYLCLVKLDKALQQISGLLSTVDLFDQPPEAADQSLYEELLSSYGGGSWNGDKDRLGYEIEPSQWRHLTATHRECSNRRCEQFQNCAFYKARGELDSADIIVANHDLVLSDLVLGGGAVLPAPEKLIYVFDEGHHLADKALNHFKVEIGVRGQRLWLKQLEKAIEQLVSHGGIPNSIMHSIRMAPEQINECLQTLTFIWPMVQEMLGENERLRFEFGRVPSELKGFLQNLKMPLQPLLQCLDKLNEALQKSLDPKEDGEFERSVAESFQAPIGVLFSRSETLWDGLIWLRAEAGGATTPYARWMTKTAYGEDWDIQLCVSPIRVADQLRKSLWWRCYGAVVTSATLTSLNTFNQIAIETGLPKWANFQQVISPFDYPNLGTICVPRLLHNPKAEGYQDEINNWLRDNINLKEGSLVLFSSRAQMKACNDELYPQWRDELLVQGFLPKSEIVRCHQTRIDEGKGGVIFGLASFAEGIDLPGDYLTHVVIVKIPFAVPDDPIQAATSEWMESQGRNPFMELTLPAASVRLVQAAGRLIRKEDDVGVISILDKRIVASRYGRLLLDALPPFKRQLYQ